jgi:hypothetical protein
MKHTWQNSVAVFVTVAFGTIVSSAMADHRGGNHGGGGGGKQMMQSRNFGGNHFNSVRQSNFHGPISNKLTPKISKPIGPLGPVGPIKTPGGPIVGPIGPIKPPGGGPIVGPVGPIGPIGPIKPPGGGPIVGPVGPIGPIGPIKPPGGGPIVGPVGPIGPIGPIKPPGGGGGGGQPPGGGGGGQPPGGGGGGCNPGGNGKHCWPPIVLGCVPCGVGSYYGCYYPPVYTQTVVVPATTSVVVAETQVVDVGAVEKLPQVPVGSIVTLQAKELGTTSGPVLLVIDKLTLGMQISEWTGDHATATVPMLGISGPTKAELVVVKVDGYAASSVKVELVPAKQQSTSEIPMTVQAR